jgi:biotin transporter BioY
MKPTPTTSEIAPTAGFIISFINRSFLDF